jgi:uncharacterized protein (DUF1778 family)
MKANPEKRGPGRPATGQMPKRYFRMDDDDWAAVESAAHAAAKTVSEFIRETILRAARRSR